jgi:hypothetical protein
VLFADTSSLAKYYVPEQNSAAIRERFDAEDKVLLSELARTELMAVFHRRLRERKWTRDAFFVTIRQFQADDLAGFWDWLPLDGDILWAAAQTYTSLPEDVFLRTADCLHLVTAVRHGFAEVHTHDAHQAKGAVALGISAVRIG